MKRSDQPKNVYERIVAFLGEGRCFAVGQILKSDGSTPRKTGVKAIIDDTGQIWGTLGGGIVEAEAQSQAIEVCASGQAVVFTLNLVGEDAEGADPICGGSVNLLVHPAVEKARACYTRIMEALQQGKRGVLLTKVEIAEQVEIATEWVPQEELSGVNSFPGKEALQSCLDRETAQFYPEDSQRPEVSSGVLVEPVFPNPSLVIVGGGHVGQALAEQAVLVGFDVAVLDDRKEFTDASLFPEGVQRCCGEIVGEIKDLSINANTYIVIVTRGHTHDAEALAACIHTPAAYIGMIGSKRKVALLRSNFLESGPATAEEFDRVFTPIGMDIGAVTVPEIATSIMAELITVRRKGREAAWAGNRMPR